MYLLKQKIEQVKQELGYKYLSYMSIDLGYAHNYLGRVLSKGLEAKAEAKLIAKLDEFLELHKKELTHDFQGKALNTQVEDTVVVNKSKYDSLIKQVDHKTQVAEKHADMRNKAELQLKDKDEEIKKIEQNYDALLSHNKAIESLNFDLEKSKRAILIWLAVSILIIVAMVAFGVLHFNGVA